MKKTTKHFMSACVAVALAAVTAFGGFGPAVAQAATEGNTTEPIQYVALGDSMTNGYGLDGYRFYYEEEDRLINMNGYLMEAPQAYPAQFAAYLEDLYGTDVDLTQLGMSGMRAEEVYYLLTYGTADEFYADEYTLTAGHGRFNDSDFDKIPGGAGGVANVAQKYKDSVATADVISIGLGYNNFGTFLTSRLCYEITQMGFTLGGAHYESDLEALLESQGNSKLTAESMEMYDEVMSILKEQLVANGVSDANMVHFCESMAEAAIYSYVGFVISYEGILNYIAEVNPEAEIMVVGMTNSLEGMVLTIPGVGTIDMGEYFGYLTKSANLYMAGLPAAYDVMGQIDSEKEFPLTVYYAEPGSVDLFITNIANEDYTGASLLHERILEKTVDMVFPLVGLNDNSSITLDEVSAVEAALTADYADIAEFGAAVAELGLSETELAECAAYIGIEDAVTKAAGMESIDFTSIAALMDEELLNGVFTDAMARYQEVIDEALLEEVKVAFAPIINDMVTAEHILYAGQNGVLQNDDTYQFQSQFDALSSAVTLKATPGALAAALDNDTINSLLHMFARFLVGDGIGCHPSMKGYDTITAAMQEAYGNQTATDYIEGEAIEALEAVGKLITEYYDEAYAYAYAYAVENGYIAEALTGLDELSAELDKIDVSALDLSDELKAELENTIENAQETIAQLQTLIKEADVLDQATLDEAIDLLNKLGQNVTDIREILTQAGIEAGEAAWEAYEEAVRIFEDEIKPVIVEKLEAAVKAGTDWLLEKAGEVYDKLVEEATAAVEEYAPEVADYIYNWLYENPDKVIAFFNEYGDDMVAFVEEYNEEIVAVLGFLVAEYGDEVADYVMENADEILAALVEFYEVHGENTWALIMVYAEELGIIDALENAVDEEAICEALKAICDYITENAEAIQDAIDDAIEAIKAEYEKELAAIEAQLKAELERLQAELEKATGELKDAIEKEIAKIEAALDALEDLKAEIESIIAEKIAELEAAIKEAEAEFNKMLEDLEAEIDKVVAEGEALLAEIKAAIEDIIADCEDAINDFMAGIDESIRDAIEEAVNDAIDKADEGLDAFLAALESGLESIIDALIAEYKEAYEDATHGEYEVTNDSYYVAIGDSIIAGDNTYEEKLAAVLADDYGVETGKNFELDGFRAEDIRALLDGTAVTDVYGQTLDASVAEGIVEEIEKADIITVSLGNDNFSSYITAQLQASLTGEELEFDWASKVTEAGVPYVEAMLEEVYAKFEAEGVFTDPSIKALLAKFMIEDPEQVMTDIVEAYAYGFAGFATNYTEVLNAIHAINPDAQVVVVGLFNPLDDIAVEDTALGTYVDYFIELSNQMFAIYAMVTPNTTFVEVLDTKTDADGQTDITDYALALAGIKHPITGKEMVDYEDYLPNQDGQEYIKDQILGALDITVNLKGDVDGDGAVTILDVLAVYNHVRGIELITDEAALARADFSDELNDVEKINIIDVNEMYDYVKTAM